MNIFHRVGLKRLGRAVDAFNGIDSSALYNSILSQNNLSFFGTGFSFVDTDQEFYLEDGYAKNSDVYAIVRKIASTASDVDLMLIDKSGGEEEVVMDGELYELLQCPNRLQTMKEYVELALSYLLITGNDYTAGVRSTGFGEAFREFHSLPVEQTELIIGNAIQPIAGYLVNGIQQVNFSFEDVMHTKYPNPANINDERLIGMSPLEAGARVLQTGNNQQEASASLLKNKGASGIITNRSDRSFTKEQGQELQAAWDAKASGANRYGKTLATSANLDYLQIGMSPTDLQIIDSQVITLRQLCSIYSVDSSLFNDPANKTFNNRKEATKALYNEAVLPNLNILVQNLNTWLIPAWSVQDNKDYQIRVDKSNIEALQEDQREEAEKDAIITKTILEVLEADISTESKRETLKYIGLSEEEVNLIVNENLA